MKKQQRMRLLFTNYFTNLFLFGLFLTPSVFSNIVALDNNGTGLGKTNCSNTEHITSTFELTESQKKSYYLSSELPNKEVIINELSHSKGEVFHLFSHGTEGVLFIENRQMDSHDIAVWMKSNHFLGNKTQLNIYGCNFGRGEKGRAAVEYLETNLGISVAASDDVTGVDGDWDLEVGTPLGVINAKDYTYNLQVCPSGCSTVADNFNTVAYSNQNGTATWSTNWVETGDDGSASTGEVGIYGSALQFDNDGNTGSSVNRRANLTGAGKAYLTFAYVANGTGLTSADVFVVEASTNGSTYTILRTFNGTAAANANYATIDLTNFISSTTYIRIRITAGYNATDWFNIDNLTLTYCPLDCSTMGPKIGGNIKDASAVGSSNGAIDLTVYGGTSSFTYNWSTGASSQDLTNLSVGNYTVTVTDSKGCSANKTFFIGTEVSTCGSTYLSEGYAMVTCGVLASTPSNQQYVIGAFDVTQATYDNTLSVVTDKHHASWVFDTIGNVFGITFDNLGNSYVTASSSYTDKATFTNNNHTYDVGYGQLGGGINNLNAAGTVYKIDACTGQASVFAQLPQQNTTLNYAAVSSYGSGASRTTGPGLGDITFAPIGDGFFFVTNFEDGKIYRLNRQGSVLQTFDPFTADNGAAGFAPLGERLWAVEFNPNDQRLYYSVWTSYGGVYVTSGVTPSTVYSVALNADCSINSASNQLEYNGANLLDKVTPWRTDLAHYDLGAPISDISFSKSNVMAIAQRNMGSNVVGWNHLSVTQILEKCGSNWTVVKTLFPGNNEFEGYGGVDWSHDEQNIWVSSADILGSLGPHGLMGVPVSNLSFQSQANTFEALAYDPSWTEVAGKDYKGVGGDLTIFKGTYYYAPKVCPTITNPSPTQTLCVGASGSNITVNTSYNTTNGIRFVKFTSDQSSTNGSETAIELANIYAGTAIVSVTPTGASNPYTATYTWNSADFPNTTSSPITYYVYAILNPDLGVGCRPVQEIQITVNPTPSVTDPADQTICAGASTTVVTFGGSAVAGTTYSWTNNTTSIGLSASGTGNITAFTATNATSSPVTATITVTPTANGCTGTAQTFTITVKPTPSVTDPADQTICAGASTTAVTLSGSAVAGTTYSWTNSTTSIGLAASGTGNITAFTATNATSSPFTATITVTPTANGCTGTAQTFTITVNPTPTTPSVSSPQMNVCPATTVNLTALAATLTPSVSGGVFEWHVSNLSGSALVSNRNAVSAGDYYLFERSPVGCYSIGLKVTVAIQTCCPTKNCLPVTVTRINGN